MKANKTEGVNIKQGTEIRRATPTENNSNAQIPIAPEAEIILEYVEGARFQLEKLKLHPEAVRTKYLELVIESGGADPEKSFREAVVWGLGGGIEYDTNLEESFQTLSTIGAPAHEEFYRVVPTLKKTMPLMKIMEAVSKRFEETEPELVIVNGSYGTQRKAYRHLSGQWSIISNRGVRRYFSTLDELYDFLATPQSAREKPKNDKDIPKKEGILVTPDFNLMIKEHRVFNVNDKRITIYEFDDGSFVTENSEGKWASFDSLESARR